MTVENRFVARMLALDPNYGSQAHQRLFVERLDRWQSIAPCLLDAPDHEHVADCYTQAVRNRVAAELQPPMSHALPMPLVLAPSADSPMVNSSLEGGGLW